MRSILRGCEATDLINRELGEAVAPAWEESGEAKRTTRRNQSSWGCEAPEVYKKEPRRAAGGIAKRSFARGEAPGATDCVRIFWLISILRPNIEMISNYEANLEMKQNIPKQNPLTSSDLQANRRLLKGNVL